VDVYRDLGRLTVPLALERGGITAERAEALAAALADEREGGSRDEETERGRWTSG
ncbi:MAG: hypothetical protein IRY97_07980, partial [Thermomicrobiaceae bacterium]|nr:hypothetical protein [Thermomicrobiaceae bacterium]